MGFVQASSTCVQMSPLPCGCCSLSFCPIICFLILPSLFVETFFWRPALVCLHIGFGVVIIAEWVWAAFCIRSSSDTHLECFISLETFPSWWLTSTAALSCDCSDWTDVAGTLPSAHTDAPSFLCICQYIPSFPSASLTSLLPLGCGFDCMCAVHAVWSCWSWQLWFLS